MHQTYLYVYINRYIYRASMHGCGVLTAGCPVQVAVRVRPFNERGRFSTTTLVCWPGGRRPPSPWPPAGPSQRLPWRLARSLAPCWPRRALLSRSIHFAIIVFMSCFLSFFRSFFLSCSFFWLGRAYRAVAGHDVHCAHGRLADGADQPARPVHQDLQL